MGTLANSKLRRARNRAHKAFDVLWLALPEKKGVTVREARIFAYAWLSRMLEVPHELCHIAMFDVEMCERVVKLCKETSEL